MRQLYLFSDVLVTGTEIIATATSAATTLSSANDAPGANVDVQDPSNGDAVVDNPYAGHLENQQISRLTQVQADVVEGDGMFMLSGVHSFSHRRGSFHSSLLPMSCSCA